MYKIKEAARRGSALLAAASLLAGIGASAMPALVSADALNPLTERTLTLTSSSPGWSSTDGSGNAKYAWPGSGANGEKTGEKFSFKVSTNSTTSPTVNAFTFQYCTKAAGQCTAPGDSGSTPGKDLDVVTSTPTEVPDLTTWNAIQARTEDTDPTAGIHYQQPLDDDSEGNFVVLQGGTPSFGWTMSASNVEDGTGPTGKNNYITLKNSTGINPAAGTQIQVIFFATNGNYITNPGSGAFFVKINDYDSTDYQNFRDAYPLADTDCSSDHKTFVALSNGGTDTCNANVIDGGVTVANVMNESIAIQTKVLETMQFSVGTIDPDTLTSTERTAAGISSGPGQCDPILMGLTPTSPHNVLTLGDPTAENSLETGAAWATHSYWRLSSNSSGGATVYYTGSTLSNTEDDHIAPIGATATASHTSTEQFGLAMDNTPKATDPNQPVSTTDNSDGHETGADNQGSITTNHGSLDSAFATYVSGHDDTFVHNPRLAPLSPTGDAGTGVGYYGGGSGTIVNNGTAKFAFDPNSNAVAVPIATETTDVVNCVTAKMRYIANIAATTPAGIYTTKINYVAAPQY